MGSGKAPLKQPIHLLDIPSNKEECSNGRPVVTRNPDIKRNVTHFKELVFRTFAHYDYDSFAGGIQTPHDDMHNIIYCQMYDTETAAFDPVFYLHHSFIDFLWAYWQELQKHRDPETIITTATEFDQPLPPFDKADFNKNERTLKHNRGHDVVDYKSNLCYEYENLKFNDKTPSEYLRKEGLQEAAEESGAYANNNDENGMESEGGGSGIEKGPRLGKCKEVCTEDFCKFICAADKNGKKFVKVYVGVVMPNEPPSGSHTFRMCQEDKCEENAGEVSTFGSNAEAEAEISPPENVDDKEFYIIEADVTSFIAKQGWSFMKPLEAKMTSSVVGTNLPDPVVITKKIGKSAKGDKGTVIFPPKDKRQRYGNLLDKYSSS